MNYQPNLDNLIKNDDYPIFQLVVEEVGDNPAQVFSLLRRIMQLSPAQAKRLLQLRGFEVARGPRMEVDDIQEQFQRIGATTQLVVMEDEP